MSTEEPRNFIEQKVVKDLARGAYPKLRTRFPPEPNGYLHLGHAKSICFNFGLAKKYQGECNLRFDDTNPSKEEQEYVESIKEDVSWLGFQWDRCCYASDYFEYFYEAAVALIGKGAAYVDESAPEVIKKMRGTLTEPGQESSYRNRSVQENLSAFERMKAGGYSEGQAVLRAKIRMDSPNLVMRDPVLYRIKYEAHQHRGTDWVIYPMYDFAHCLSDAHEGISHSICTLEFQDNRELYDWVLEQMGYRPRPHQYEFARLNIEGTVLSKRKLNALIDSGRVEGWADPRMPTLRAARRRGYPAQAIRTFCARLGIAKQDNASVPLAALETCVREVLNRTAPRCMGVLKPLKLKLVNLKGPAERVLRVPKHPLDPSYGEREIRFGPELYIDERDFRVDPISGYKRLAIGQTVRLRNGCMIRAVSCSFGEDGRPNEVLAEADLESFGGDSRSLGKPSGVLHWVSATSARSLRLRLYQPLFIPVSALEGVEPTEEELKSGLAFNPHSLEEITGYVDPSVFEELKQGAEQPYQFEREGYFYLDPELSRSGIPVLHRTVSLRNQERHYGH